MFRHHRPGRLVCTRASGRPRAFTLVETLVAVALIIFLLTLLVPALSVAREKARRVSCAGNQKHLSSASTLYGTDYQNRLPWGSAQPFGYAWSPGGNIWRDGNDGGPPAVSLHSRAAGLYFLGYTGTRLIYFCPSGIVPVDEYLLTWIEFPTVSNAFYAGMEYYLLTRRYPANGDEIDSSGNRIDPQKITDPPEWILWADRNDYQSELDPSHPQEQWYYANHIPGGMDIDVPSLIPPAGTNVTYLDGSVQWRNESEMDWTGPGHKRFVSLEQYFGW